jgi:hypothetical protein
MQFLYSNPDSFGGGFIIWTNIYTCNFSIQTWIEKLHVYILVQVIKPPPKLSGFE